jgi:hypothetical protein
VTDAEIMRVASDLMVSGSGATTERLANRFGVDIATMAERLIALEAQGRLLSVARWGENPGMGEHYWVRPGEAAAYLSGERYDEFEQRVRALATWKGYQLVTTGHGGPARLRRYKITVRETADPLPSVTGGQRIEKVLWKLRQLPPVSEAHSPSDNTKIGS